MTAGIIFVRLHLSATQRKQRNGVFCFLHDINRVVENLAALRPYVADLLDLEAESCEWRGPHHSAPAPSLASIHTAVVSPSSPRCSLYSLRMTTQPLGLPLRLAFFKAATQAGVITPLISCIWPQNQLTRGGNGKVKYAPCRIL